MSSLKNSFSSFTLTLGQTSLVEELQTFLEDDSVCFLMKGYAGTGKTFLMKGLSDYLQAIGRQFRIAAPTGRAAKVIAQKTKHKAYTIHKTIYSSTDLKEYKVKNIDGSETFKFFYDLRNNDDKQDAVYIIDESSMISNEYSEGEFFRFGSGYLLKDLVEFVNLHSPKHKRKILFIGDDAQLPPVNMNFSPALDAEYLLSKFGISAGEFELTEVVRQKEDSGILKNATAIRNSIKAKAFGKIVLDTDFRDVHKTLDNDLLHTYLKACNNAIDPETIIIAYSNAQVKEYNDLIRAHFFPEQKRIAPGDTFVIVANNYNYQVELLNGDFGKVLKVDPHDYSKDRRTVVLKKSDETGKINETTIMLSFINIVFSIKDLEDREVTIQCKVIENLLNNAERDISSDEQKALYIDFWIRNPKLDKLRQLLHAKNLDSKKIIDFLRGIGLEDVPLKTYGEIQNLVREYFNDPKSNRVYTVSLNILKDALRNDPYFNALRIKYGYAITCHKAQGGEWQNVFLNCKTAMGYFNATYFRWLYTGITRASNNLYTINPPCFGIAAGLTPPKFENVKASNDIITLSEELCDIQVPHDFPEDKSFLKALYLVVLDKLKDENIEITHVRHHDYHEIYQFSKGNESVSLKVHYNKKGRLTSAEQPAANFEWTNTLSGLFSSLINKNFVMASEATQVSSEAEIDFDFPQPHLQEFYEALKIKINPLGIAISNIEHKNYHEIYHFKRGGLAAVYKFHYDGKNRFKKTEVIHAHTTGLIEEINSIL